MSWKLLDLFANAGTIASNVANITTSGREFMEKLAQQQLRFEIFGIGDLSDEAIVGIGLRTAAKRFYKPARQADEAFGKLDAFLRGLDNHQRIRLRRTIAKLVLTERHENVVVETKTDKDGAKTERHDRRQVDYEYTADDPRVQFIVNMAKELMKPGGPVAVKDQLLAFDIILEKAIYETLREHAVEFGKTVSGIASDTQAKTVKVLQSILDSLNGDEDEDENPTTLDQSAERALASIRARKQKIQNEAKANSWIVLLTTSLPGLILIGMTVLIVILALGTWMGWKVLFGIIGAALALKYVIPFAIGWYRQSHP